MAEIRTDWELAQDIQGSDPPFTVYKLNKRITLENRKLYDEIIASHDAELTRARAERDAALEDGEEREAYKQVIDWGRGLANQVLEMVNLHYTEKEETFKPFAILPPMSQLLSYYAATLNEWIGKLIGEEPK